MTPTPQAPNPMKNLLVATAIFETITGIALMVSPALPVSLLIGAALDTTGGLIIARVAAAALLSLGLACWLARDDGRSRWPAVLLHLALAVWCAACLRSVMMHSSNSE